jgi:hypothetical protein
MKPTMVQLSDRASINKVLFEITFMGDIRLVPFYDTEECRQFVVDTVNNINIDDLKTDSNDMSNRLNTGEQLTLEFKWTAGPYNGVVCDIDGNGYKLLYDATKSEIGEVKPTSKLGSLPLVNNLKNMDLMYQSLDLALVKPIMA